MKKLIFIILLIFASSQISYSQYAKGTMGKTVWSDSAGGLNWWNMMKFRYGITTYGLSFFNGSLSFGSGYGILTNGGNINLTNGGAYLLEGVNINTIFGRLGTVNTWTNTNTFNGLINFGNTVSFNSLSYFNTNVDVGDSVYIHGGRINIHDGSYELEGKNLLSIISDSLRASIPANALYYSKKFTQNTGQFLNSLQKAVDSANGRTIYVLGDTITENIKAPILDLYLYQGSVLNAPSYYTLRCDSTKTMNWRIRGQGTINGILIENSANNNVIDIELSSMSGLGINPAFRCNLSGTNPSFYLKYDYASAYSSAVYVSLGNADYRGTIAPGYTTTTAGKYVSGPTALDFEFGNYTFTRPLYAVGNCGTIVNLTVATGTFNSLEAVNLNDTGHCLRLYNAQGYGTIKKLDNRTSTIYSAINHVSGSYGRFNLIDTINGRSCVALEEDANSDMFIDGGFLINNTNTGANTTVIAYGGGQISNCVIKNLASTDARVLDLGTGGSKKFTFLNCTIQGNSTWALAGVGGNSGKITFRNTLFTNLNTSSYCLKNYSTGLLSILAYNSNTNVPNYAIDSHRFVFPYDSIRVLMPFQKDTIFAAYDTTVMSTRKYANHRVDSALAAFTPPASVDTSLLKHKADTVLNNGYTTKWFVKHRADSMANWNLSRFGKEYTYKAVITQVDTSAPTIDKFLSESFSAAGGYHYTTTLLTREDVGTYSLTLLDENSDPMELFLSGGAWGDNAYLICPQNGIRFRNTYNNSLFYVQVFINNGTTVTIYTLDDEGTPSDNLLTNFYLVLEVYYE